MSSTGYIEQNNVLRACLFHSLGMKSTHYTYGMFTKLQGNGIEKKWNQNEKETESESGILLKHLHNYLETE